MATALVYTLVYMCPNHRLAMYQKAVTMFYLPIFFSQFRGVLLYYEFGVQELEGHSKYKYNWSFLLYNPDVHQ